MAFAAVDSNGSPTMGLENGSPFVSQSHHHVYNNDDDDDDDDDNKKYFNNDVHRPLTSLPSTPRTHNKNKRLLNETLVDNSNDSASFGRTNGVFDWFDLQSSLKRVKLTPSLSRSSSCCSGGSSSTTEMTTTSLLNQNPHQPLKTSGGIRLDRDLQHAVDSGQWHPISSSEWRVSNTNANFFIFIQQNLSIPMELTIRMCRRKRAAAMTSIVLLFPKLYPHQPPQIVRIDSRDDDELQKIRKIVICTTPDEIATAVSVAETTTTDDDDDDVKMDTTTTTESMEFDDTKSDNAERITYRHHHHVIVKDWSPIERLTDLVSSVVRAVIESCCKSTIAPLLDTAMLSFLSSSTATTPTMCNRNESFFKQGYRPETMPSSTTTATNNTTSSHGLQRPKNCNTTGCGNNGETAISTTQQRDTSNRGSIRDVSEFTSTTSNGLFSSIFHNKSTNSSSSSLYDDL